MVAEQQGRGQYILLTDSSCVPRRVSKAEGLVVISYKYIGFGAYDLSVCAKSMGRMDWTLDPICCALIKKGWSQSIVKMHFLEHEPLWNVLGDWLLMPIKPKWDGSQEKYLITQAPTKIDRSSYGPDWAIQVHLEDNGYLGIHVRVPEIYETNQPGKLLMAIKSLPDASKMQGVHSAMLAAS